MEGHHNVDKNLYYIMTYKCATTSMKYLLMDHIPGHIPGWTHYKTAGPGLDPPGMPLVGLTSFSLVREPFERYISGALWHWWAVMVQRDKRKLPARSFMEQAVAKGPRIYDIHTIPQVEYHRFRICDTTRARPRGYLPPFEEAFVDTYVAMDDKFAVHLGEVMGEPGLTIPRENDSSTQDGLSGQAELFREMLGEEGKAQVQDFYAADYEVWNKVTDAGGILRCP